MPKRTAWEAKIYRLDHSCARCRSHLFKAHRLLAARSRPLGSQGFPRRLSAPENPGRGIEHDWPGERLKSRMRQRPTRMGVPLSTRASRRRGHRAEQDRLDAVESVVREQRTVIARAGREQISLSQHVDRTGGIGHDLLCQPVKERSPGHRDCR